MDYRKFLGKSDESVELVLPYFGGTRVEAENRRFRVVGECSPGWWRFAISNREARPSTVAEPVALEQLPAVRGHYVDGWLFASGSEIHRLELVADEPEPFAPCVGRRWYGGELLLDSVEFEDEAEGAVRRALEDSESIGEIKGVSPGLRAAYGYAIAAAAAAEIGAQVSAREIATRAVELADRGREAALEITRAIEAERQVERAAAQARLRQRTLSRAAQSARLEASQDTSPARRADRALEAAGARMLRTRHVNGLFEVVFQFMGERFISTVEPDSLRVVDSGICLDGADRELNLKSLPSAIREAIDGDLLYITRH